MLENHETVKQIVEGFKKELTDLLFEILDLSDPRRTEALKNFKEVEELLKI